VSGLPAQAGGKSGCTSAGIDGGPSGFGRRHFDLEQRAREAGALDMPIKRHDPAEKYR
jgi:hypothetical protein